MHLLASKLICCSAAILTVGAVVMHAQDDNHDIERFDMGQRLGDCLIRGCMVFTGIIESLGKLEKEPGEPDERRAVMTREVNIKVREWLHGARTGDSVQLLYAAKPALTKTALGPWVPWEGVNPTVGGELLVVRWAKEAPRPAWLGQPEDVALVVPDKGLFAPIREAISWHQRFAREPDEVAGIPKLIRDKRDSLLTGYFIAYLTNAAAVRDVDRAAVILGGLIPDASVPVFARDAVGNWVASTFYRLNESTRNKVTEALVIAASSSVETANPALSALTRLGDQQMLAMKPYVDPARQRNIVANYQAFRVRNKLQKGHPEFEAQLGLQ